MLFLYSCHFNIMGGDGRKYLTGCLSSAIQKSKDCTCNVRDPNIKIPKICFIFLDDIQFWHSSTI